LWAEGSGFSMGNSEAEGALGSMLVEGSQGGRSGVFLEIWVFLELHELPTQSDPINTDILCLIDNKDNQRYSHG